MSKTLPLPRSSNIAEGWHLRFKSLVHCTHPTHWIFLDANKLEQGLTDQKIADRLMLSSNIACRNIVLSQYSVLIDISIKHSNDHSVLLVQKLYFLTEDIPGDLTGALYQIPSSKLS